MNGVTQTRLSNNDAARLVNRWNNGTYELVDHEGRLIFVHKKVLQLVAELIEKEQEASAHQLLSNLLEKGLVPSSLKQVSDILAIKLDIISGRLSLNPSSGTLVEALTAAHPDGIFKPV